MSKEASTPRPILRIARSTPESGLGSCRIGKRDLLGGPRHPLCGEYCEACSRPCLCGECGREQFLFKPKSFEYYQTDRDETPAFTSLPTATRQRLERELDDWFEESGIT